MRRAIVILVLMGCAGQESPQVYERSADRAVRDGVAFLVDTQNRDGSWGSAAARGFDIYAPVPGAHQAFRAATTALCVMALREVGGKDADEARRRGVEYLLANGDVRRADAAALYNIWAHIYIVQALSREYALVQDPRLATAVKHHIDMLARYETAYGGWNYYDFIVGARRPSMAGTSFATGAGVVALDEARQAGFEVPEKVIARAVHLLEECRQPEGNYLYDLESRYYPRHPANKVKGSVGRAQAPNCALWAHGRLAGFHDVRASLARLAGERRMLEIARKRQWPHEAFYYNSGYYYYFAHYYASRLIEALPPSERPEHSSQVLAGILPFQEPDGSWWDFPLFGYDKPYGTAFALMAIHRAAPKE